MARSSSTSRAARLAQRSGKTKVRFQGGTLFPAIVAVIIVLGMASIVYARQSRPAADDSPPTTEDHWHASYGFYVCDPDTGEMGWKYLSGDQEIRDDAGEVVDLVPGYQASGVHSHDDEVIHWHPFSSRATGRNAQLGIFLDSYGVNLSNDELDFPDSQNEGIRYEEGETECGGEDAQLRVQVWDNFEDTDGGSTFTSDFDDIPFRRNSMIFAIAYAPDDVVIPKPPAAPQLTELGAVDSGATDDPTATTVPGTGPAVTSTPGSGVTTTPGTGTTPASGPATTVVTPTTVAPTATTTPSS
ncbi:MAG: hypothetical protein M3517_01680 [Actinomycetota bacterium]|nr:hypothetical protein [Actinomycetota bacterium]